MGVQTMSSLGGGGGGGGGGVPLSRQGSVYGLTLNEVESHLGEPLRSMNLEDLLRTVLPADAADAEPHGAGTGRKTVDEVWRDIESAGRGRQPTVGEMTLEDFLSRAGVPVGGGCAAGAHWLHQYHPPQQYVARPLPRPLGVGAGPVLDAVYHGGGGGFLSQVGGRKRGAAVVGGDGVVEKTVERRQKRMIKNRESAARSRARKQAYTNELENKISRLEEEIEHLKELKKLEPVMQFMPQQEAGERQHHLRRQAVLYMPQPEAEPKQHQLRRINSASF
ncbi:ABSCISIC ACID-INSENSITIVE 5-like protein 3 [Hordeum vulgare subsp. vulgare]|uniref:BZIP domain-containing protein n=1 Tax=Hordeum vulgare subsp. vulgare TaxID=112509 RepID=A0A8I6WX68_HORVV|nr:ABSCISIC ACID-INSENSITIVE 5-like protein 3 [Hordeum vulgare subsp. vulgare]